MCDCWKWNDPARLYQVRTPVTIASIWQNMSNLVVIVSAVAVSPLNDLYCVALLYIGPRLIIIYSLRQLTFDARDKVKCKMDTNSFGFILWLALRSYTLIFFIYPFYDNISLYVHICIYKEIYINTSAHPLAVLYIYIYEGISFISSHSFILNIWKRHWMWTTIRSQIVNINI